MLLEFCRCSISIALTCKEATLQFVAEPGRTVAVTAHYLPIVGPDCVWSQAKPLRGTDNPARPFLQLGLKFTKTENLCRVLNVKRNCSQNVGF